MLLHYLALSQTDRPTDLVNKVQCHSPLPNLHLLALKVLPVVLSYLADTLVQLACRLVFHPIFLAFQLGRSVQHDVLGLTLNVLRPRRKPRHLAHVTPADLHYNNTNNNTNTNTNNNTNNNTNTNDNVYDAVIMTQSL